MTRAASQIPVGIASEQAEQPEALARGDLPEAYQEIRADPATQFEPLKLTPAEPREPSWLEEALQAVLGWLGEILGPVGGAIATAWPVLKLVLIAGLVLFVITLAARLVVPIGRRRGESGAAPQSEPSWRPSRDESLALLEDADRLARQGRYGEAVRLLLGRSVAQIASARPDWVAPSSTARELSALPRLPETARHAFGTITALVERSLFALQSLSVEDWEQARSAYADFALERLDASTSTEQSQ